MTPLVRCQRLVLLLAGAALASGLFVPVNLSHSRLARAATVTVAPDETTASADAEAQGTPVEALSDRTDSAQVFANPDGTTATYPSVLSGVDLVLTATTDGVIETLVVQNAAAASNPALSNLAFAYDTSGLTLTADGDGGAAA